MAWSQRRKIGLIVGILVTFVVLLAIGMWFVLCSERLSEPRDFTFDLVKIMLTPRKKIRADLEAELEKIREASAPLTMADLVLPPVPEAENAAVVYNRAFEKLDLSDSDREMLADYLRTYVPVHDRQIPLDELERIVGNNRAAIKLLEEAAKRPICRFPIEWEAGMETKFPHLKQLRNSAYLLAAKVVWHAERNQMTPALETARVSLAMGEAVRTERVLISELARYAITKIVLSAVECALYERSAPEGACWKLYEYLGETEFVAPFVDTMRRERAMAVWGFEMWRQKIAEAKGDVPPLVRKVDKALHGALSWTPLDKLTDYDQIQYLQLVHELIAVADMPYRESHEAFIEIERRLDEDVPGCCIFSRLLVPVMWKPVVKRDETIARVGLAQAALALKAYNNKMGQYPASLAELRKVIPWELREDPCSGQDFLYQREGDGFLVYSLGPNLKDDSGMVAKDSEEGDIIWRCKK